MESTSSLPEVPAAGGVARMKAWADIRAHLLCHYMWLLRIQLSEWTHQEGFLTSWVIPGKASDFPEPHGIYLMARWWRGEHILVN